MKYEMTPPQWQQTREQSCTDTEINRALQGALQGCVVGGHLVCLDCVDSTNNYAKTLAEQGAPHGTVVLSTQQTAGRGRRDNGFASPAGKGLYLSVLLRPQLPAAEVIHLTAWIAVAVCDAIQQAIGLRPGIKWTNDIILHRRKLGGILTEMSLDSATGALQYVVAGVGINVSQTEEDFGAELKDMAISLEQALGHSVDRNELAAAVIRAIDAMVQDFPAQKERYLVRYRADCLTTGQPVRLLQAGQSRSAFAESIDEDFALVVRWEDGSRGIVNAGDVSVRGLLGYV